MNNKKTTPIMDVVHMLNSDKCKNGSCRQSRWNIVDIYSEDVDISREFAEIGN
jgi:hypothetical protein